MKRLCFFCLLTFLLWFPLFGNAGKGSPGTKSANRRAPAKRPKKKPANPKLRALSKKAQLYASDKRVRDAVSRLNYKVADELSRVMNYQSVSKQLFKISPALSVKQPAALMVVTRDGHVLHRSTHPGRYDPMKDKIKLVPGLSAALRGKAWSGTWTWKRQQYAAAMLPIKGLRTKAVKAALVYMLKANKAKKK